jgi:DNA-binding CsgD family transcriptional regulator
LGIRQSLKGEAAMGESIKTVKVLLIDKDEYFMEGLRQVISDFYLSKDTVVRFVEQPLPGFSADIIFQAIGYGVTVNVWKMLQQGISPPLFFLIRDRREVQLSHLFQPLQKNGTLYRHQSVDAVKRLLAMQQLSSSEINVNNHSLTPRERQVLRWLGQGKSLLETANKLSLKDKTVSTHKRTAMRKLNFKRNHELYHWLLQGGLTNLENGM